MSEAEFWRTAETVLTEKQLTVLRYKAAGFSKRRMAVVLDVSTGTIEGHLAAAARRLRKAGVVSTVSQGSPSRQAPKGAQDSGG